MSKPVDLAWYRSHVDARGRKVVSREYSAWGQLKNRCLNRKSVDYARYGARGITLDPSWNVFENFLADMGPKPKPTCSIERLDNTLGFTATNCRWGKAKQRKAFGKPRYGVLDEFNRWVCGQSAAA